MFVASEFLRLLVVKNDSFALTLLMALKETVVVLLKTLAIKCALSSIEFGAHLLKVIILAPKIRWLLAKLVKGSPVIVIIPDAPEKLEELVVLRNIEK